MERDRFRLTRLLEKTRQPDRQEFSQLLTQLAVPPDLCYLKDALNRTQTILEQHGDELDMLLQRVPLKTLGAESMREIADKLLRHPEMRTFSENDLVSAPMVRASEEAKHPLRGYCLDVCHFWANLFFRLPLGSDDSLVQSYDHLAGQLGVHIIAANARVEPDSYLALCTEWARRAKQIPREGGDSILLGRSARASRAFRQLSDREFENALDILVNHAPSDRMALRLRSALRDPLFSKPKKGETNNNYGILNDLCLLLDKTQHGWRVDASDDGTGGGHAKTTRHQKLPTGYVRVAESQLIREVQSLDEDVDYKVDLLPARDVDSATHDGTTDGLHEFDMGPAEDPATSKPFGSIIVPAGAGSVMATGRLRATTYASFLRKLQGAPNHAMASFSTSQIRILKKKLADKGEIVKAENLDLIVRATLATGRDPRDTRFVVYADLASGPDNDADPGVFFAIKERMWSLPAQSPAFAAQDPSKEERRVVQRLHLPDLIGFGIHASNRLSSKNAASSYPLRFDRLVEQQLHDWLKSTFNDPRLGIRSLSGFLFARLMKFTKGDLALSTLVSGHAHAHGRTTSHYSAIDATRLHDCYIQAMSLVAQPNSAVWIPDAHVHLGARRVPTRESVKELVRGIAHQVLEREGQDQVSAYTAYTMIGIHLGLAARPLIKRILYDGSDRTGFITLIEKARTPYHYRLLALPPAVHDQIANYINFLRNRFPDWQPEKGFFFRFNDPQDLDDPFVPKDFKLLASGVGYGLELYSLRRFMRTELLDRGVDAEDIDAFLGHWFERCSPHDPLSTYPPRRLSALAKGPISDVLFDVGFQPIRLA